MVNGAVSRPVRSSSRRAIAGLISSSCSPTGEVAIVGGYQGPDERLIVIYGAGRFMGELSMLTGQPSPNSAVVVAPGEVLEAARRLVVDRAHRGGQPDW